MIDQNQFLVFPAPIDLTKISRMLILRLSDDTNARLYEGAKPFTSIDDMLEEYKDDGRSIARKLNDDFVIIIRFTDEAYYESKQDSDLRYV